MSINKIYLPGLDRQIEFLRKNLNSKIESALVIGSASEEPAKLIAKNYSCPTELIVEDYESLMNSKLILEENSEVIPRMMEFEVTDFTTNSFDMVYAQASISRTNRNKIVKEIKRLLKPGGFFCVGEIVSLQRECPAFVKNIFDSSDLLPLFVEDLKKYYEERAFEIIKEDDLTSTLKEYYSTSSGLLKDTKYNLTDKEKSFYKKLLNKASHESNAYLKLGADKYIGFFTLLLQKGK
jgi:SAM-dependent methyltransferase